MIVFCPGALKEWIYHFGGHILNTRGVPHWTMIFIYRQRTYALNGIGFSATTPKMVRVKAMLH
jgi:hypothetical protein